MEKRKLKQGVTCPLYVCIYVLLVHNYVIVGVECVSLFVICLCIRSACSLSLSLSLSRLAVSGTYPEALCSVSRQAKLRPTKLVVLVQDPCGPASFLSIRTNIRDNRKDLTVDNLVCYMFE